jgi:hypothetical protein
MAVWRVQVDGDQPVAIVERTRDPRRWSRPRTDHSDRTRHCVSFGGRGARRGTDGDSDDGRGGETAREHHERITPPAPREVQPSGVCETGVGRSVRGHSRTLGHARLPQPASGFGPGCRVSARVALPSKLTILIEKQTRIESSGSSRSTGRRCRGGHQAREGTPETRQAGRSPAACASRAEVSVG